jgi:hypothetical protein
VRRFAFSLSIFSFLAFSLSSLSLSSLFSHFSPSCFLNALLSHFLVFSPSLAVSPSGRLSFSLLASPLALTR